MKSYIVRVYVESAAGTSQASIIGIVEEPDTGVITRFRDSQELWAIVSTVAPPSCRASQYGSGGNGSS
jgi:hypothetical protein